MGCCLLVGSVGVASVLRMHATIGLDNFNSKTEKPGVPYHSRVVLILNMGGASAIREGIVVYAYQPTPFPN